MQGSVYSRDWNFKLNEKRKETKEEKNKKVNKSKHVAHLIQRAREHFKEKKTMEIAESKMYVYIYV